MSNYSETKCNMNEETKRTVTLNNKEITLDAFREATSNLRPNQKLVETQEGYYYIVERMWG